MALAFLIDCHELGATRLTGQLRASAPMVVMIVASPVAQPSADPMDVANGRVRRASAVEHGCLLRTEATADRPSMDGRTGLLVGSLRRQSGGQEQYPDRLGHLNFENSVYKSTWPQRNLVQEGQNR